MVNTNGELYWRPNNETSRCLLLYHFFEINLPSSSIRYSRFPLHKETDQIPLYPLALKLGNHFSIIIYNAYGCIAQRFAEGDGKLYHWGWDTGIHRLVFGCFTIRRFLRSWIRVNPVVAEADLLNGYRLRRRYKRCRMYRGGVVAKHTTETTIKAIVKKNFILHNKDVFCVYGFLPINSLVINESVVSLMVIPGQ